MAKVDGGTRRMAELVRDIRAGIELTTTGLPTFDIADAQELYDATLGGCRDGARRRDARWWWRRPGRCCRCRSRCC